MRKTPTRPGPVAYVGLGLLIAVAFTPLVVRVVAYDVSLGRAVNLTLFGATTVLFVGAGAYTSYLMVRHFRAARAEDLDRITALHQRVEEIEEQSWWGKPTGTEDTVELGPNVHPIRGSRTPEKRSS